MVIGNRTFNVGDWVMVVSPKSARYYYEGDPAAEDEKEIGITGILKGVCSEFDNPFAAAVLEVDEMFRPEHPGGKFLLCCDDEIICLDSG